MKDFYVYIMTNNSGALYVGVTNNLERRVSEHKLRVNPGFTSKYKLTRLVYYGHTTGAESAISREKVIKGWVRRKKIALIASANPYWRDLSETLGTEGETLCFAQGDNPKLGTGNSP